MIVEPCLTVHRWIVNVGNWVLKNKRQNFPALTQLSQTIVTQTMHTRIELKNNKDRIIFLSHHVDLLCRTVYLRFRDLQQGIVPFNNMYAGL